MAHYFHETNLYTLPALINMLQVVDVEVQTCHLAPRKRIAVKLFRSGHRRTSR